MRHVAVFDTNVLLSGVGWKGKPLECLELARSGMVEAVTCQEILDELAEILAAKLKFPPDAVTETPADLKLSAIDGRATKMPRPLPGR